MRPARIALLLLVALAVHAADPVILPFEPDEEEVLVLPSGDFPGRVEPAAPAEPVAVRIRWDEYVSLLVVGDAAVQGRVVRRPAWIVTYDTTDTVVVAYRATAYRDAAGTLHFDARRAILSGPKAGEPGHEDDGWSPDSFSITREGRVETIDDKNRANTGTVIETVAGGDAYLRLLQIAMSIVREAG